MRVLSIARPFAGGYRSDVPDYALNASESAYAQDVIYPKQMAHQRWGWAYDDTAAAVAQNLVGVSRDYFALPSSFRTTASDSTGDIWLNGYGSYTKLYDSSTNVTYLPRCMYNGDLIWCAQDGETPLLRYAGFNLAWANSQNDGGTGTWNIATGASVITLGTMDIPAGTESTIPGLYATAQYLTSDATKTNAKQPSICVRTLGTDKDSLTLEGIRALAANKVDASALYVTPLGVSYPCVPVHDAGFVKSVSSGATSSDITTDGARLSNITIQTSQFSGDTLLVLNPTPGSAHEIGGISATSVGGNPNIISIRAPISSVTNATYRILRRCPFKDATVHKGSFWGTGVKQYPNRVYVAPPGWSMGLAPQAIEPFDPTVDSDFVDLADFVLQPIDVPSAYDSDPVVALLPTPGPLLVLKTASVYGIYGTSPSFEQTLVAQGAGCIDLRSAVTVSGVAFWAGMRGIYMYAGGQIQNITSGRIEREWQSLMRGWDAGTSYCTIGVVADQVVVSLGGHDSSATASAKVGPDSSSPTNRAFIYDLNSRTWAGRMSNMKARYLNSSRSKDEIDALLAVSDDYQGRIIDIAPALTGLKYTNRSSGTVAPASPADAAGSGPAMQAWTGAALAQATGIEGEARFCDAVVHANICDSASPTSSLSLTTAHGEGLYADPTVTKSLDPITADTTDRVDRFKRRVNRTGRLHQLRVAMTTTDADNTKSEIPEVVITFRDNRRVT
jgi:hypothetical protein